jgi:arginine deiminase
MKRYGCQSMYAPMRRLVLKHPREAFVDQENIEAQWRNLVYLSAPDFDRAVAEYDRFAALLARFDFEIHFAPLDAATGLDSIYMHDPLVISNRGAILGMSGKEARIPEAEAAAGYLRALEVPILGRITGSGKLEGGDILWVDERTLAVGQGFRTNAEGLRQLAGLLGDLVDEVIPVPLPYWTGPRDCLHLMSFISIVDRNLAVVYSRLMPVPFREWLLDRDFQLVEVPDEEYATMACNVLAVAPRQCVMLSGNPITKKRLEQAGAQVWTYEGKDICIKGAGGPTCLTRPILRAS